MPKRRKRQQDYDSYDEWEDEQSAIEQMEPEVAKIRLEDFTVKEKVSAFQRDYEPCQEFDAGAERFGDAELREFFKAYVTGLGDPLALYVEDLKMADFRMQVSLATGKPCIFARRRT